MSRLVISIALAAAFLLPSGCVSMAYGPVTAERPYGYSETQRADGSYILRVVYPDGGMAMAFWDQRATELCASAAYSKNIYQAVRPTMLYANYGGTPGAPQIEGILTCGATAAAAATE